MASKEASGSVAQDKPASKSPLPAPFIPLPLSWHAGPAVARPRLCCLRLPLSGVQWVAWADCPADFDFLADWRQRNHLPRKSLLVRGVPQELKTPLVEAGAHLIHNGIEARLPTDRPLLKKKSLRELVRRGQRWGQVRELRPDDDPAPLAELLDAPHSRHCLKHLFRTEWAQGRRYFAFLGDDGRALAAISLTRNHPQAWHTELWLRHPQAPVGVMEALIAAIWEQVREEGAVYLSLGELPFRSPGPSRLSRLLAWVGHRLRFAYNTDGLYRFKCKFQPDWHPLFLAADRPPNLFILTDLFFRGGGPMLVMHGLRKKLPV